MTTALFFLTMIFFGGFGLGYGVRSWRSRKRRERARLYGALFHSGTFAPPALRVPARRGS